jgi:hypothetical protein
MTALRRSGQRHAPGSGRGRHNSAAALSSSISIGSADVFVFNKGDSYDTVWNFSAAEGDKIRLVNEPGRPE